MSEAAFLHTVQKGSGLPLLCLAGFGCSHWIFEDMAEAMQDVANWVMPDPRGMGRTPFDHPSFGAEDLALDALAVMDRLGYDRFAVLGISMGGFLAEIIALRAPTRVKAAVLMCTSGPGPDFVPIPQLDEEMLRSWYELPLDVVVRANTDATVHPSLRHRDPSRYQRILDAKLANQAALEPVLAQQAAMSVFLKKSLPLADITCPTLILTGSADRLVDPENSRRLEAMLPNARLAVIPQTDHLFFLEKPVAVHAEIRAFLEAL